jgi:hypothetical protein
MTAYTGISFPRWYDEGYADFFSTFEVTRKGNYVVGKLYQPHGYPLVQKKWMPGEMVFGAIRNYPFVPNSGSRSGLTAGNYFYAQSWLAVHHIIFSDSDSKNMTKYLAMLNSTEQPEDMFEQAFGRSPEEFDKEMHAYFKRNKFMSMTIKPDRTFDPASIQVRKLSEGEALFYKAEAMRLFRIDQVTTKQIIASTKRPPSAWAKHRKYWLDWQNWPHGRMITNRPGSISTRRWLRPPMTRRSITWLA